MEQELKMIKDGANANGLRLIGDRMIGYCFAPRNDLAKFADDMLGAVIEQEDSVHVAVWCEANKDGDYSAEAWKRVD